MLRDKLLRFTDAVEKAVKHNNWYAALSLALTLPDICGRLERPTVYSKVRYPDWFNKYLLNKYTMVVGSEKHVLLTGGDCYALRCSFHHEGRETIEHQKTKFVLDNFRFVSPIPGLSLHKMKRERMLLLQVDIFCKDICSAVKQWVTDVEASPEIQKESELMLEIQQLSWDFSF